MDFISTAVDLLNRERAGTLPSCFRPKLEVAEAILEVYAEDESQYFECMAEAGMGAVAGGWDGYDGMSVYAQTHEAPHETPLIKAAQAVVRENAPMFEAIALVVVDTSDDLPF